MERLKNHLLIFIRGVAMGGADIVPGVSGGTVAFITGIYERLLNAINSINLVNLKLLIKFQFRAFWKVIDGAFLLALVLGIATSIFSLSSLISYLMINNPIQLWSFFLGLILASAVLVLRQIRKLKLRIVIFLFAGMVLGYLITTISPSSSGGGLLGIFLSGSLAICAMILPGISGSFILLILGKYEQIIGAIKSFDIVTIMAFAMGAVVGLLSFSRLVGWLLKKYHDIMVGVLAGFMIGSLNKIWPWKRVLQFRIDSQGDRIPIHEVSILPNQYQQSTGHDPQFLSALLFLLLGLLIIVAFERLTSRNSPQNGH